MNIEDQFGLEHLLFEQRKCKICGESKELINDFASTQNMRPSGDRYNNKAKTAYNTVIYQKALWASLYNGITI